VNDTSAAVPHSARLRITVIAGFAFALVVFLASQPRAAETADADAERVAGILEKNCSAAGCHGGAGAFSFDARNLQSLVDAKVVEPGNAAASELMRRVESGAMPLGGYQNQAGVKLPDADIQTLKRWIDGGAVPPKTSRAAAKRPFISEADTLASIVRDLEASREVDRRFYRYYSIVNLWNTPDVSEKDLALYRSALGKLVNHLSWEKEVSSPLAIGTGDTILRIDLRDYGWTVPTWNTLAASYPYAVLPNGLSGEAERVRALSGAIPPYLRADWFTAKASVAPLYHELLQLPDMLEGLERRLALDTAGNLRRGSARRFGVRDSGVSRNNRAVERQSTPFGGYWKSFDFGGNRIEQNIFRDPVHLTPDGGEVIFNLPNGLQGYLIVDSQGRRIDDAPVAIVRDRTNTDDPVVHNGRSCMGCHFKGLNAFRDEVATSLETRSGALFDVKMATNLYRGQAELDRLVEEDNARFARAINRSGGAIPASAAVEPVSQLARRYERTLDVSQAAAELDIADPVRLQKLIEGSVEVQRQGFDPLLGPKGGIQRDTWEQGFGRLAQELGVGVSAARNSLLNVAAGTMLRIELANDLNIRMAKVGDTVSFRTADDLRVNGRVALPKGSMIRSTIAQIQPSGGNDPRPAFLFTLDEAQPRNGATVRLSPSVVTMRDPNGAINTMALVNGLARVASTVNNGGGGGWNGLAGLNKGTNAASAAGALLNQSPRPANAAANMLPRGAMFEARF
jgi:hypothetical protein